ncbi:MAG: 23S rRNA methyltransferase [Betaproteobacteria bacterium RIFCSPHIGHO2_12_FULL_69_13]|nr:MAG: 23S rRNA methyltransferase [Betaproteobacteria bacterium RIFCSPHIGHO2_12_FULL_69_13]OGA69996.1 MAG: 23S rRNA methyltransferase [Betaproteobacteria bacterium RIFCSPLOWO2_12_FULL_68_20]
MQDTVAMAKSSRQWLHRQSRDPYARRAREAGYRSRAAFKLLGIDAKDRLLLPGMTVVDLGAAPGSWSQVAAGKVRPGGKVIAIDLLEIAPISGVTVLRGDIREGAALTALRGECADVVLCDVSPNLSGIAATDQARSAELARAAIEFCRRALKPQGAFLVKAFQGAEFASVLAEMKRAFREVTVRKPAASRGESRETYLLARGLLCPAKTA